MKLVRTLVVPLMIISSTAANAAGQSIDLSNVKHIRITGAPDSVVVTTNAEEPFTGKVQHRRSCWVGQLSSILNYDQCATESSMTVEDDTLTVVIVSSELSSCHATFTANVGKRSSVSIERPAAQIDLKGVFKDISMHSAAADFKFSSEVQELALKAQIAFTAVHRDETIVLASKFMDADMHFGDVDAISYRIGVDASMVNSRYPHTQGVKPEIRITAEKARININ